MNETPYEFRERVATLWKCCDEMNFHPTWCRDRQIPDCEWTRKSQKRRIAFYIGTDYGRWKYGFSNPDDLKITEELWSVEQLKNYPNLNEVTIAQIYVEERSSKTQSPWRFPHDQTTLVGVEMAALLRVVVLLSNEPELVMRAVSANDFRTPEGVALGKLFETMKFSRINCCYDWIKIWNYSLVFGNQFLWRKPTYICLCEYSQKTRQFFIEHLANGDIKRVYGVYLYFPATVMEGIISSFLRNPENYEEGYFDITYCFDKKTEALLSKKRKKKLCEKIEGLYCFKVYNAKLGKYQCLRVKKEKKENYFNVSMKML